MFVAAEFSPSQHSPCRYIVPLFTLVFYRLVHGWSRTISREENAGVTNTDVENQTHGGGKVGSELVPVLSTA